MSSVLFVTFHSIIVYQAHWVSLVWMHSLHPRQWVTQSSPRCCALHSTKRTKQRRRHLSFPLRHTYIMVKENWLRVMANEASTSIQYIYLLRPIKDDRGLLLNVYILNKREYKKITNIHNKTRHFSDPETLSLFIKNLPPGTPWFCASYPIMYMWTKRQYLSYLVQPVFERVFICFEYSILTNYLKGQCHEIFELYFFH